MLSTTELSRRVSHSLRLFQHGCDVSSMGEAAMSNGNQQPWWVKEQQATPPVTPRLHGIAYYHHSARDRQENSVAIQQALVQKWAKENGVDIIFEFADRGKSGLTAEGRDGFNDMMENWVKNENTLISFCVWMSAGGAVFKISTCRRHTVPNTKLGKLQAGDRGQMQLYLRWLEKYEMQPGEVYPLGLILCSDKKAEQIELLQLDKSGIRIVTYLTELLPRPVLEKRLHQAASFAQSQLSNVNNRKDS